MSKTPKKFHPTDLEGCVIHIDANTVIDKKGRVTKWKSIAMDCRTQMWKKLRRMRWIP